MDHEGHYSPLTMRQEGVLSQPRTGVCLVFGSEALGIPPSWSTTSCNSWTNGSTRVETETVPHSRTILDAVQVLDGPPAEEVTPELVFTDGPAPSFEEFSASLESMLRLGRPRKTDGRVFADPVVARALGYGR